MEVISHLLHLFKMLLPVAYRKEWEAWGKKVGIPQFGADHDHDSAVSISFCDADGISSSLSRFLFLSPLLQRLQLQARRTRCLLECSPNSVEFVNSRDPKSKFRHLGRDSTAFSGSTNTTNVTLSFLLVGSKRPCQRECWRAGRVVACS